MISSRFLLLTLSPIILLAILTLLQSSSLTVTGAPQFYDPKLVTPLTSSTFRETVAKENQVVLVNFYLPRNGKCKEFASQYATLAKGLKPEFLTTASVDCKENSDICSEQEFDTESGAPLVKLYANKKIHTYKGEMKHKEVNEWVWKVYPNHVIQLTAANEKKTPRDQTKTRVLLFTDKRQTGPLYKSLALTLRSQPDIVLAEVRKTEKRLLDHYGIGKTFPVIMIEPATKPGEEERSARRYDGKFEKPALLKWIASFTGDAATSAGATGEAAAASDKALSIPELVDQSCLEKYCGGPLCIVMFLSKDHPDLNRHLTTLATIEQAAKTSKKAGKFNFVYADSVVAPHAQEWLTNFDLQPQDYPQLILLSVRKERFASYVGSFSTDGVLEFLTGITKGSIRTIPFMTKDKKLTPLPAGTACPPDQPKVEEKKPSTPSSTPPTKDEGELVTLTTKNHAEEVLQSPRPWVTLFHAGDTHAAKYANLSTDFERVAKNMKDMVYFGEIDVTAFPELAQHWSIDVAQVPVIYSLPHKPENKIVEKLEKFETDFATMDAKALRAFSQELLKPAKVLTVTSQSMQQFMGDLQPNTPFPPKFILFAKPGADGAVAIPDMVKALSLEFGPGSASTTGGSTITFGVASSRERDLARQFNVTKIPAVFTMGQQEDMPGQEPTNQIRVAANQFGGPIVYSELHAFCEMTLRNYNNQRLQWLTRAGTKPPTGTSSKSSSSSSSSGSKKSSSGSSSSSKKGYQPPPRHDEDEDHVDLDAQGHDEL